MQTSNRLRGFKKTAAKLALAAACSFTLLAGTAQAASITAYNDRASFNAASGATTIETFNSYATDTPFHTTAVNVGDFTISLIGINPHAGGHNQIDAPAHTTPEYNLNNTSSVAFANKSLDILVFTFNTPIKSFGADFNGLNKYGLRTHIEIDGQNYTPPQSTPGVNRFYGLVSDTFFSTVKFIPNGSSTSFGIDDVTYGAGGQGPPTVPTPTASLAGLLGFGLVATLRRKRKA